jgi:hypothetical protein
MHGVSSQKTIGQILTSFVVVFFIYLAYYWEGEIRINLKGQGYKYTPSCLEVDGVKLEKIDHLENRGRNGRQY